MILLALFFDFLEFSQKYDDKVWEEEARRQADAESAAQSPKPCPLCGSDFLIKAGRRPGALP
jgi:hypothetical protein